MMNEYEKKAFYAFVEMMMAKIESRAAKGSFTKDYTLKQLWAELMDDIADLDEGMAASSMIDVANLTFMVWAQSQLQCKK